ncbi:hypothetical protein CEXT_204531 [Caerostris extrusa]|uniref:Uncharacterized protein n=1 Tax=Caerostris extrusa TaxID=172846 RepID=A0AAV4P861_CAEEX|nr:hypothetical protein CEXT_204531 [Caerostris extrusa]
MLFENCLLISNVVYFGLEVECLEGPDVEQWLFLGSPKYVLWELGPLISLTTLFIKYTFNPEIPPQTDLCLVFLQPVLSFNRSRKNVGAHFIKSPDKIMPAGNAISYDSAPSSPACGNLRNSDNFASQPEVYFPIFRYGSQSI